MSRATGASIGAQLAVLDALHATDRGDGITTVSDRELQALTGYSARTIGYALRDLRGTKRIDVRYTHERQRAIKVS